MLNRRLLMYNQCIMNVLNITSKLPSRNVDNCLLAFGDARPRLSYECMALALATVAIQWTTVNQYLAHVILGSSHFILV